MTCNVMRQDGRLLDTSGVTCCCRQGYAGGREELPHLIVVTFSGHVAPIMPDQAVLQADGKLRAVGTVLVAHLSPQLILSHCKVH